MSEGWLILGAIEFVGIIALCLYGIHKANKNYNSYKRRTRPSRHYCKLINDG